MEAITTATPTNDSPQAARCAALRADGNAAFKAGDFAKARKLYTAALSLIEDLPDEPVAKLEPTRRAQLLANRMKRAADTQGKQQQHPGRRNQCSCT